MSSITKIITALVALIAMTGIVSAVSVVSVGPANIPEYPGTMAIHFSDGSIGIFDGGLPTQLQWGTATIPDSEINARLIQLSQLVNDYHDGMNIVDSTPIVEPPAPITLVSQGPMEGNANYIFEVVYSDGSTILIDTYGQANYFPGSSPTPASVEQERIAEANSYYQEYQATIVPPVEPPVEPPVVTPVTTTYAGTNSIDPEYTFMVQYSDGAYALFGYHGGEGSQFAYNGVNFQGNEADVRMFDARAQYQAYLDSLVPPVEPPVVEPPVVEPPVEPPVVEPPEEPPVVIPPVTPPVVKPVVPKDVVVRIEGTDTYFVNGVEMHVIHPSKARSVNCTVGMPDNSTFNITAEASKHIGHPKTIYTSDAL